MIKVFISYATENKDIAYSTCEYLESRNIKVWIAPRDIQPGDTYASRIMNAIKMCDAMVLVASKMVNQSSHVINEVSNAFDKNKIIIPFRIDHTDFTDEYKYFLGRKHWIDATVDYEASLELLYRTLIITTGEESQEKGIEEEKSDYLLKVIDESVSDEKLIDHLIALADRNSYSLLPRILTPEKEEMFIRQANTLFHYFVELKINNKEVEEEDYLNYLLQALNKTENKLFMKVMGNAGTGKNMVLQLIFYSLIKEMKKGNMHFIPYYVSMAYYEKLTYHTDNIYEEIKKELRKELEVIYELRKRYPDAVPLFLIDAVREHSIYPVSPENVLHDLMEELGYCRRVVSVDTGLVKNRSRLKHVIPVLTGKSDFIMKMNPIPLVEDKRAMEFISCVSTLYGYFMDANEIYNVLQQLKYERIDLFTVRLIIKEIKKNYGEMIYLNNMYEEMALREVGGKEEKLLKAAETIFSYNFTEKSILTETEYTGKEWSLVHKHNSYRDYMLAFYFVYNINHFSEKEDNYYLDIIMENETNTYIQAIIAKDYEIQEKILYILKNNYDSLSNTAKCTCIFWLGKMDFQNLISEAKEQLKTIFVEVYDRVKEEKVLTRNNLDFHLLLRAVAYCLIQLRERSILEKYLLLLITNDAANKVNQIYLLMYYESQFQYGYWEYFLDFQNEEINGIKTLRHLSKKLKNNFINGTHQITELLLVSYMNLLQNKLQNNQKSTLEELSLYVDLGLKFLKYYKRRPQMIYSEKILLYLDGMEDDLNEYTKQPDQFNIGQKLFERYHSMKDIKRSGWVQSKIDDPESLSEHTFSSWMLAMLFLPEYAMIKGYNKQEILNMIMIHSMAETVAFHINNKNAGEFVQEYIHTQNAYMKKIFLKGTYNEVANLDYFYNVWEHYEDTDDMNALIAKDIAVIQTIYSFCVYYDKYPEKFTDSDIEMWQMEKSRIRTEIGYNILEKLIEENQKYSNIFNMELVW